MPETRVRRYPRVPNHPSRLRRVLPHRQPVRHRAVPVTKRLAQVRRVVHPSALHQRLPRVDKVETRAVLVDEVLQRTGRDELVLANGSSRRRLGPGHVEVQEPRRELTRGGVTVGGTLRLAQVEPPAQVRLQRVHLVSIPEHLHHDVGVHKVSSLGVAPRRLARVVRGHRALSLRAVHLLPLRIGPAVAQRPGEIVPRQVPAPRVLVLVLRQYLNDVPAGRDQERNPDDVVRRQTRVVSAILSLPFVGRPVGTTRLILSLGSCERGHNVVRVQFGGEVPGDGVDRDEPLFERREDVVTGRRHRTRRCKLAPGAHLNAQTGRERNERVVLEHRVRGTRVAAGDVQVAVVDPVVRDQPRDAVGRDARAAPIVRPRVQLGPVTPAHSGWHGHDRVDATAPWTPPARPLERPRERVTTREAPQPRLRRHQDDVHLGRAGSVGVHDARPYPAHRPGRFVRSCSVDRVEVDQQAASLVRPTRAVLAASGIERHLVHAAVGGAH